jgi:hypothetical protein
VLKRTINIFSVLLLTTFFVFFLREVFFRGPLPVSGIGFLLVNAGIVISVILEINTDRSRLFGRSILIVVSFLTLFLPFGIWVALYDGERQTFAAAFEFVMFLYVVLVLTNRIHHHWITRRES